MIRRLFAALLITLMAAAPALAAEPFTAAQKAALNEAIKQYISDNPQVLISSVESFYNKQKQDKQVQEGPLKEMPSGLLNSNSPSVGPKDAKVSVVEFFDYNCGYCKQVATDVERLVEEDKTVRVVFKDLPILSDSSELAARYALAADKQGKYMPYHLALLQHQGPISETYLVETAKSVGLDTDKLKKDANTQDIRDVLAKNVALARELGVRGTPFFVIGKQKVPGAIGYSRIKEIIAQEGGTAVSLTPPTPAAPAAAAAPEAAPSVKSEATTTSTDTSAATSDSVLPSDDADTDAEVKKVRADAAAMVEQIKAEAAKMQATAVQVEKDAVENAAKEKAKQDAASAAASKK